MSLDVAIRLTEIFLVLAFIQQSIEHIDGRNKETWLYFARIILCVLLLFGVYTPWICMALLGIALWMLSRYDGPYNGGSDRMGLLVLCSLCLVNFLPQGQWREYVFGYLAIQLVLSYFISGWVKLVNREWRNGQALRDVFQFSAYPVSEDLRALANRPQLLLLMSWAVILFELLFPFSMITQISLIAGLTVAAVFHLANACLFGLNRFFWIWLTAYPSLIWFQQRILDFG